VATSDARVAQYKARVKLARVEMIRVRLSWRNRDQAAAGMIPST
jgi:hypothetical protein